MMEEIKAKIKIIPTVNGVRVFLGDIDISQYVTELSFSLLAPGDCAKIKLTVIGKIEVDNILASIMVENDRRQLPPWSPAIEEEAVRRFEAERK